MINRRSDAVGIWNDSLSTHFVDQDSIACKNEKHRLDVLSNNLDTEIELASASIQKLERLQERYYQDGLQARIADLMGYYIRYVNAYERTSRLIEARYLPFRPVLKNGTQHVC